MKNLSDLVEEDFLNHPAWFQPMVESASTPETSVVPVLKQTDIADGNVPVFVRAKFQTASGRSLCGFVSWVQPERIEDLQPVIFAGKDLVYVYSGIIVPDEESIKKAQEALGVPAFPITFQSEEVFGLSEIAGKIEGLYYVEIGSGIKVKIP